MSRLTTQNSTYLRPMRYRHASKAFFKHILQIFYSCFPYIALEHLNFTTLVHKISRINLKKTLISAKQRFNEPKRSKNSEQGEFVRKDL